MTAIKILKYATVIGVGIFLYSLYKKSQSEKKDDNISIKTEGKIIKK